MGEIFEQQQQQLYVIRARQILRYPRIHKDSHLHLLDYPPEHLQQVMAEAKQAGVEIVVCNTTHQSQYPQLDHLSTQMASPRIIRSYGIHPYQTSTVTDQDWIKVLEDKIKEDPENMVGEIGLDFRNQILENNPKDRQMEIFNQQVLLACSYQRTMSVHCVRAHGDMLKYFKKLVIPKESGVPNIVMHSYGGSKEITLSLLKLSPTLNIYFSLCQKRNSQLCKVIPLDKLLFETDAPYQLDPSVIPQDKLLKVNQNEIRLIRTNSALHHYYDMDVAGFVSRVFANSLKAFRLVK